MKRPALILAGVMAWALVWTLSTAAWAHEVRPAYLEIDQTGPGTYSAIWKQPTMGEIAIHLTPHLSNGWLDRSPTDQYAAAGYLVKRWSIHSASPAPLAGAHVTIDGLEQTITDVFVRVRLQNGQGQDSIMRPETPSLRIAVVSGSAMTGLDVLGLGLQHIVTGPDHLLFVLGRRLNGNGTSEVLWQRQTPN